MLIHGKRHTRIYSIWLNMKTRCYNKNNNYYEYYGRRGIKICNEWRDSFQAFYDWAMENGYQDGLTIDRVDTNSNYEPSNCRWTDRKQQSRNRRNNKKYTINGETHCLSEWCEILNLNYKKVKGRLYVCHWPIEKALELEDSND